jgi:hypothetical protein
LASVLDYRPVEERLFQQPGLFLGQTRSYSVSTSDGPFSCSKIRTRIKVPESRLTRRVSECSPKCVEEEVGDSRTLRCKIVHKPLGGIHPTPDGPAPMNISQHKMRGCCIKTQSVCVRAYATHTHTHSCVRPCTCSTQERCKGERCETDDPMDLMATADLPHTLQGDGPRRAALGRTGLYGWRATQGRHEEGPVCSTAGFYPLWTHYRPPMDPYRTVAKRSHRRS